MGVASRRKSNSAVVSVLELEGKEEDRNQEADVLNNCCAVGAGQGWVIQGWEEHGELVAVSA
jgi:hypothetical protein